MNALLSAARRVLADAWPRDPRARTSTVLLLLATAVATALGAVITAAPDPIPLALTGTGGLLACALLLARRTWPGPVLVGTGLLIAGQPITAMVVVPVVAFAAGRRLPPWRLSAAVAASAAAATVTITIVEWDETSRDWPLLGIILALWAPFLLVPAACGALVGQRRPAGRLLRDRNDHLERTQARTAARARRAERARIAGEMHDMLGHRLSLLSIHAGALEMLTERDAPAVSEQAQLLRHTASTAMAELRQLLQLNAGAGDEHAERPDSPAAPTAGRRADVEALVARSREAGLPVVLTWSEAGDPDDRVRQAVHRVVREGLTNVHKHAPTTPSVAVQVDAGRDRVRVVVASAAATGGPRRGPGTLRGLVALDERARLLGGTCRGRPTAGGGFVLTLDVPAAPRTDRAAPDPPADAEPADLEPADLDAVVGAEPLPVGGAAVLSTRRAVLVAVLAALLAVPLLFLAIAVLLALLAPTVP